MQLYLNGWTDYDFLIFFIAFDFVGSAWSFWFFHPRHNGQWPPTLKFFYTRSYPLHYFLILILEKEPVFPFSMLSAKQGNYWYHSLVWRGPWLGIEPGSSRTRSQHSTTRLSSSSLITIELNTVAVYDFRMYMKVDKPVSNYFKGDNKQCGMGVSFRDLTHNSSFFIELLHCSTNKMLTKYIKNNDLSKYMYRWLSQINSQQWSYCYMYVLYSCRISEKLYI